MDLSSLIGPAIIALITGFFGSGIFALIASRRNREAEVKKLNADTAQIIQDAAGDLIVEYKKQLQDLKDELAKKEAEWAAEIALMKSDFAKDIAELKSELVAAYVEIAHLKATNKELNKRLIGLEQE